MNLGPFECAHHGARRAAIFEATRLRAKIIEAELRRCLSHWVSELEPTMLYREGEFLGLGIKDDPTGAIVVGAYPLGGIVVFEGNPSPDSWFRRLFLRDPHPPRRTSTPLAF